MTNSPQRVSPGWKQRAEKLLLTHTSAPVVASGVTDNGRPYILRLRSDRGTARCEAWFAVGASEDLPGIAIVGATRILPENGQMLAIAAASSTQIYTLFALSTPDVTQLAILGDEHERAREVVPIYVDVNTGANVFLVGQGYQGMHAQTKGLDSKGIPIYTYDPGS